jgi:uncharacterized protein (TIGR04222 family)
MNPYDLTAGPFLKGYILLFAACIAFCVFMRRREADPSRFVDAHGLSPIEWAYVAGGPGRAVDTAVVGLLQAGAAVLGPKAQAIDPTPSGLSMPAYLAPFRRLLVKSTPVTALGSTLAPALDTMRAELAGRGLVRRRSDALWLGWLASGPLLILAVAGGVRIYLGSVRHHPVGFITMLTFTACTVALALATRPPRVTPVGRSALRSHKAARERLMRAPTDAELVEALALTGGAVLAGTPYAAFAQVRADSGGSGGSSCGGGGDGGGGGCGGCGGGH